jgi:2-oxoglutarate ferredoxin oxidoreductase subunit alpha
MYGLTKLAFELADKYRNPAIILADGVLGQVLETVDLDAGAILPVSRHEKEWVLTGSEGRPRRLSLAHFPAAEAYDGLHRGLQEKYQAMRRAEQRSKEYYIDDDARLVIVAYGVLARNCLAAVRELRRQGYPVGLFRPVTLFPFPALALRRIAERGVRLMVVEMSAGQMAADVMMSCPHNDLRYFPGQATAMAPGSEEIAEWAVGFLGGEKARGKAVMAG